MPTDQIDIEDCSLFPAIAYTAVFPTDPNPTTPDDGDSFAIPTAARTYKIVVYRSLIKYAFDATTPPDFLEIPVLGTSSSPTSVTNAPWYLYNPLSNNFAKLFEVTTVYKTHAFVFRHRHFENPTALAATGVPIIGGADYTARSNPIAITLPTSGGGTQTIVYSWFQLKPTVDPGTTRNLFYQQGNAPVTFSHRAASHAHAVEAV
jgi:hypothetical protein